MLLLLLVVLLLLLLLLVVLLRAPQSIKHIMISTGSLSPALPAAASRKSLLGTAGATLALPELV
jgi:hypothetical protein